MRKINKQFCWQLEKVRSEKSVQRILNIHHFHAYYILCNRCGVVFMEVLFSEETTFHNNGNNKSYKKSNVVGSFFFNVHRNSLRYFDLFVLLLNLLQNIKDILNKILKANSMHRLLEVRTKQIWDSFFKFSPNVLKY